MNAPYSDNFTKDPRIMACLADLKEYFGKGRPLVVSDVLDGDGHQYVHLVQKGGGVLGIALVGYTYILEEMGIRFIRLAGTSAGAINTGLMTVTGSRIENGQLLGDKKAAKSEAILNAMGTLNFFGLVDGHVAAQKIIKIFVQVKDLGAKVKKWAIIGGIIVGALFLISFVSFGLRIKWELAAAIAKISFILAGLILVALGVLISYGLYLLRRLKVSGYGINPGNYFLEWVEEQFVKNNVKTVTDLRTVASTKVKDLVLRKGAEGDLEGLDGDVTFITSELVTENKIEFPLMAEYFTHDLSTLSPAGFIRASMSIPIFFASYFIPDIPCGDQDIRDLWRINLGEDEPPSKARFVDGGILSNFPINIFYNAKVLGKPRLPSLGIDLDDNLAPTDFFSSAGKLTPGKTAGDDSMDPGKWSLMGYIGRLFNTTRFYYDKDFLIKNAFFKKGIGKIPLKNYNWLNFFMNEEEKLQMFILGAKSASKFLREFNWDNYKDDREDMNRKIMK